MSVLGEIGARSESAIRTAIIDPQDRFFITVSDKTINVQSLLAQRQISSMSHVDGISSVSLSPDGNSIASTSYDYTVRIWDVLTGQELFHKELINSMATSVDFSPDGKYILVGYYDQISRIWDISTGSEVARFVCMNMNAANFVSFSPDGKLAFTGCRFDAGYIWDVSTGEQISYAKGWFYGGNAMFSPDNRYMASAISGSPSDAVVWDILSGKELFRINHKDNVAFVTFSPSGNFIASASYDHTIKVWDVHNRKKVLTLFHESGVTSLDFSADENFLVSGSVDKTVRVWDLNSKQEVARYFHSGAITSVSFSPTGKYIISSSLEALPFLTGEGYQNMQAK